MIYIHRFLPDYHHRFELKYHDILKANGIPFVSVDSHDACFWDKLKDSDLFIMFLGQSPMHLQRQLALISCLEHGRTIKCFPDWNMAWHFDDKVSQQLLLEKYDLPVIPAKIFWDKEMALQWATNAEYPQVFKLKGGAGSLNVAKVESTKQARKLINLIFGRGIINGGVPGVNLTSVFLGNYVTLFKSYIKKQLHDRGLRFSSLENWDKHQGYAYFQNFMPNNRFDTRITVIGSRAFGFIRNNRPRDFRSSGSGKIDFSPEKVNLEMVRIAFNVSEKLNFATMAYDFLYDSANQPVINEMCCQFADWAVYECPGFWDKELNWNEGHYWPQYLQLIDLLNISSLQQPAIELYKGVENLLKFPLGTFRIINSCII